MSARNEVSNKDLQTEGASGFDNPTRSVALTHAADILGLSYMGMVQALGKDDRLSITLENGVKHVTLSQLAAFADHFHKAPVLDFDDAVSIAREIADQRGHYAVVTVDELEDIWRIYQDREWTESWVRALIGWGFLRRRMGPHAGAGLIFHLPHWAERTVATPEQLLYSGGPITMKTGPFEAESGSEFLSPSVDY